MKLVEVEELHKEVIVEVENKAFEIPEKLQKKIDENWEELIHKNSNYTRGIIYCVENIIEDRGIKKIKLVNSDYAHYMYDAKYDLEEQYKCKNCWAGTILETTDDIYIIGRMHANTSVPNKLQFSGGNIDSKEIKDGIVDMKKCAIRELKEEINIDAKDYSMVESFECMYLSKEISKNSIGIMYKAKLRKSYQDIIKHYKKYKEYLESNDLEIEFSELVGIEKNNVKNFFESSNVDYEDSVYPVLLKDSETENKKEE